MNSNKNKIYGIISGCLVIVFIVMLNINNYSRDKNINDITYTRVGSNNSNNPFNYAEWLRKKLLGFLDKNKPAKPTPAPTPKSSTPKPTIAVVLPTPNVIAPTSLPTIFTPQPTVAANTPTPAIVTPSPVLATPLPTVQIVQPTIILPTATPTANTQIAAEINAVDSGSSTDINGILTTIYKIDENLLRQKLGNIQTGSNVNIIIPGNNPSLIISLSGQIIKELEVKDIKLSVNTAAVNYVFTAGGIRVDEIAANIGANTALSDIAVNVSIKPIDQTTLGIIKDIAQKENFKIEVQPVNTSISVSYGTTVRDVKQFNDYASTLIRIPDSIGSNEVTTAISPNSDGSVRHIPTDITVINDKYYAKVNSLTNTTYTLIWNPKEFGDMSTHWAKTQVNEMYSRKVINGASEGKFEPDRSITRAEFATIVVKALGLEVKGANSFTDVKKQDWFYGYVGTANTYGIILGVGDGVFDPLRSITRQEAMAMVQRASKIAGMNISVTDNDVTSTLAQFTDKAQFSDWARSIAAFNIRENLIKGSNGLARPLDKITRAETTVIVMRMLQRANLIDSRIKA